MFTSSRAGNPILRAWPEDRYELRCERLGRPPSAERLHFAHLAVAAARELFEAEWVTRARVVRLADNVVIIDLGRGPDLPTELPEEEW